MRTLALALILGPLAAAAQAQAPTQPDPGWPQWLGPSRDGRSPATSVFPAAGSVRMHVAWRQPLGPGSAGLSVSGDHLVTLDSDAKGAWAVALSPRDGSLAWRVALDPENPDEERGPGSTPAIADGVAFVLSPACQLRALEVAGGRLVWQVDLKARFGSKLPQGCVSSPLVDGSHVIVQTGAPDDKRVVALDRRTGTLAWAAQGVAPANFSSPGVRGSGATREILIHHTDASQGEPRSVLAALRAEDGRLVWQHALEKFWSWATPVPVGENGVLLLTWNDAVLLEAPAGTQPATVAWRNAAYTAYVAAPVYRDGYLYGHGGDYLRCLRAKDGATVWQERTYPGSVVLVDGHLVVLSVSSGLLRVVDASPEAYRERARLQVAEPGSHIETPPSVVGRRIFVRGEEAVVAVDVDVEGSERSALPAVSPLPAELLGAWAGTIMHEGDTTAYSLELEPGADGKVLVKATVPTAHLAHVPLGSVTPQLEGRELRLGPFALRYDPTQKTLTGVVPEGFAPVYRIPLVLRHAEKIETPARAGPGGTLAEPLWSFDAGSPLWPGPTLSGGLVFVGAQDGQLHAVDAGTGRERWSFRAGGAVRTRPTQVGKALVFQADDGFLYRLDAATGKEAWRVKLFDKPVERLPFDNPKSRYDRFGSDVTAAAGRLYLGTHDGHVIALDPATGARLWDFGTGDSVLAAPSVDSGRVYVGSYDKSVYALDAATGRLLWQHDTQGAVVSTPAVVGDLIVVGNRCYDLLGIKAATGEVAWKRYLWFSWVESSATVRDGVAYVGSSDAALVWAVDAKTGATRWQADVYGWAWGQPAVTESRVYLGTSSQVGYPAGHRAGMIALDRATGRIAWRYESKAAAAGAFGFPGSPAVGQGVVFVSGLDGRLYAFRL